MDKYLNAYAISLAVTLLGCIVYSVFIARKHGFQSIQEKELVLVFADFIAICAALKIIYLSFDEATCSSNSRIDMTFLAVGGAVMLLVSSKDLVSKFR